MNTNIQWTTELHGEDRLTISELVELCRPGNQIQLSPSTLDRVAASRATLDRMVQAGRVIYGVNTSVGGFVNVLVPIEHAPTLQNNLIHAVATNIGPHLPDLEARAIMLARIKSLARGNSAISVENLQKLVEMFNRGVVPCIPEIGSLGTSGDLAQLAAIALVGTGQWKARVAGEEMPGADALMRTGIKPMLLSYKEGLALVNGTSGMVGLGAVVLTRALHLFEDYLQVTALSFEGLAAKRKPLDPRVHELKPHRGQRQVAHRLWEMLSDSRLAVDEHTIEALLAVKMGSQTHADDQQIEDAYSLRCSPQVLGPVLDTLDNVEMVLEDELNSSNDNPLVIPDEDEVFHNGHFHGQYVAMAMDHLVIALVTLCNLADRRIDRYLKPASSNGLPAFLCRENPGLRLGMMGGQFMSASVTAEVRSLAMPVSIQSLPSTGDFQDIVSLGFVAARRARTILDLTQFVVAFELLCACQAVDIRGSERLGTAGKVLYDRTRSVVPYFDHDCVMSDYLQAVVDCVLTCKVGY